MQADILPDIGTTLLKILKGTGVFFHPTLKRVNSIILAEILVQTMIW